MDTTTPARRRGAPPRKPDRERRDGFIKMRLSQVDRERLAELVPPGMTRTAYIRSRIGLTDEAAA